MLRSANSDIDIAILASEDNGTKFINNRDEVKYYKSICSDN